MKMTLLVIVFAVAAGLAVGGSLRNLVRLWVRWPILAPVGLGLQLAPVPGHALGLALLYLSFAILLIFVSVNTIAPGVPLIALGLLLNLAVIAWNGGMPVTAHALAASHQQDTLTLLVHDGGAKHHLASPSDGLLPLADVIPVGWGIDQAVSVGDIATHLGIWWLLVMTMWRPPGRHARVPGGRRLPRSVPVHV